MRPSDKDRAWKQYKDLKSWIRDRQCRQSEMHKPTEVNVKKCMQEIQLTSKATKELKRIGRVLGESTNTDAMRSRF